MKVRNDNLFLNKIFVPDPLGGAAPIYDRDNLIPVVVVNKNKEIEVRDNAKEYRVHVDLFEPESDKEFNDLSIQALVKSCEISNSVVPYVENAKELFSKRDLIMSRVLISKTKQLTLNEASAIASIWGGGCIKSWWWIHQVDGLKDNEILLVAEPEYLGVIPYQEKIKRTELEDIKDEIYGIGVINTNGAVLVRS